MWATRGGLLRRTATGRARDAGGGVAGSQGHEDSGRLRGGLVWRAPQGAPERRGGAAAGDGLFERRR
uniref:Uncharacterized protein n=1 Tax=Arundo donax TaxID=35708 RepID=A0A0A8YSD9_ARUDO